GRLDEDRGRSIRCERLENSEHSVNTVRRVLAAPVVADLEATFRVIVPKAAVSPCRIGSSAAQRSPSSPRAGPSPPSYTRRDGGGAAGGRQAWAEDGSQTDAQIANRERGLLEELLPKLLPRAAFVPLDRGLRA